jgi:Tfp pilus assembly protein FimV
MKVFFTVLVVTVLAFTVVSCKSTPKANGAKDGKLSEAETDAAFENAYSAYRSKLVLDGAENYTVVRGDTLTKIAAAKWGAGNGVFFPLILAASPGTVNDPDKISPGMKLKIPDLQKNLDKSGSRTALKAMLNQTAPIYVGKGDMATAKSLREKADSL